MLGRLYLLLAVVSLSFIVLPGTVYGHSVLEESEPADGDQLEEGINNMELSFSTKVENGSTLSLISEDDQKIQPSSVDIDDNVMSAQFEESLSPGEYDVNWEIVGADGHPIEGQYTFSILGPGSQNQEHDEQNEDDEGSEVVNNAQNSETNNISNQKDNNTNEGSSLGMGIVVVLAFAGLILAGGMWIRKRKNRR
ncbi:copper resistance protein CopC [Salinicoccus sp. ID82-1]|uniref:copper resistance CopC family protein n=1 Tax=Salinicoccus sp. ID82-1 TaxID=2820269 RepID=UPI001F314C93|nr:copper resistance protein CopC [Salinicoccus sp. ID82-1]MCG1010898.1 copper resistance protein CopC [Salinicoccus sp. ID82-1]